MHLAGVREGTFTRVGRSLCLESFTHCPFQDTEKISTKNPNNARERGKGERNGEMKEEGREKGKGREGGHICLHKGLFYKNTLNQSNLAA